MPAIPAVPQGWPWPTRPLKASDQPDGLLIEGPQSISVLKSVPSAVYRLKAHTPKVIMKVVGIALHHLGRYVPFQVAGATGYPQSGGFVAEMCPSKCNPQVAHVHAEVVVERVFDQVVVGLKVNCESRMASVVNQID